MVIVMIQQNGADESDPRDGHHTFPFFVKVHVEVSRASSIFFSISFALSRLLGCGCEKFVASLVSAQLAQRRCPHGRDVQGQLPSE